MNGLTGNKPKETTHDLQEEPSSYSGGRNPYPLSYRAKGVFPNATVAEAAIGKYLREYHPAGYGTQVAVNRQNQDGTVSVEIWRSASCD